MRMKIFCQRVISWSTMVDRFFHFAVPSRNIPYRLKWHSKDALATENKTVSLISSGLFLITFITLCNAHSILYWHIFLYADRAWVKCSLRPHRPLTLSWVRSSSSKTRHLSVLPLGGCKGLISHCVCDVSAGRPVEGPSLCCQVSTCTL